MRPLILLVALLTIPSVACAELPAFDRSASQRRCESDWGTDYAMVRYCLDGQEAGHRAATQLFTNTPAALVPALDYCLREWRDDWEMVAYCGREQFQAAANIEMRVPGIPDDIAAGIMERCRRDWQPDLTMIEYCSSEAARAWLSLQ